MGDAIKADDPRLGHFIIGLPIVHLLLSSLFIWGYGMGFGAELNSFITTTDLFTTSIRDMVLVYISGVFIPILFLITRYGMPYPNAEARIDALPQESDRLPERAQLKTIRRGMLFIVIIATIAVFAWQKYQLSKGEPFYFFHLLPLASLWSLIGVAYVRRIWWMTDLSYEIAVLLLSVALSAAIIGLHTGHRHRYAKWSDLETLPTCDNFRVIRSISDRYLAIDNIGRHSLIDADCKIKFRIPSPSAGR